MKELQEKIYRDYHSKVFGYVSSRVNSREDAEDITANIFMKVFSAISTYDESKASVSTWIYRITHNAVIDFYRMNRIHVEIPEDLESEETMGEELFKEETLRELREALKAMPQQLRDIIVLRYYKGLPLTEIAKKISLSYGATKLRHKQALKFLRERME